MIVASVHTPRNSPVRPHVDSTRASWPREVMVRCPSQIRAGFFRQERLSHRTVHGNYLDYVRTWGKKKGLYSKMLKKAYGKQLDDETLKKLEGWMQTDHLIAPICDDPQNFFLMFRTLNNKFSFENLSEFKKEFTGDGWEGAVELANSAVRLQLAAL